MNRSTVMDNQGKVIKYNQNTSRLSGYETEELIGRNVLELLVTAGGNTATPDQVKSYLEHERSAPAMVNTSTKRSTTFRV